MRRHRPTRNPTGTTSSPIALRLTPDERAEADRLAEQVGFSRSKLARMAFLAGLKVIAEPNSSTASNEAVYAPGGVPPSAAGVPFSSPQVA